MRKRTLNHAACIAASIILLGIGCRLQYGEGWERVSESGLTVMMPGKPERIRDGNTTSYVLNHNGEVLTASYDLMITPAPEQIQPALDAVRNGFVMSVDGALLKERSISLDGVPGRELVVEDPKYNHVITQRMFMAKSILYQVGASTEKGKRLSEDAQKYLDSVDIQSP